MMDREADMSDTSRRYYLGRASEAREKAASTRNEVVRQKYIELAEIYEMCARRARPAARPEESHQGC